MALAPYYPPQAQSSGANHLLQTQLPVAYYPQQTQTTVTNRPEQTQTQVLVKKVTYLKITELSELLPDIPNNYQIDMEGLERSLSEVQKLLKTARTVQKNFEEENKKREIDNPIVSIEASSDHKVYCIPFAGFLSCAEYSKVRNLSRQIDVVYSQAAEDVWKDNDPVSSVPIVCQETTVTEQLCREIMVLNLNEKNESIKLSFQEKLEKLEQNLGVCERSLVRMQEKRKRVLKKLDGSIHSLKKKMIMEDVLTELIQQLADLQAVRNDRAEILELKILKIMIEIDIMKMQKRKLLERIKSSSLAQIELFASTN